MLNDNLQRNEDFSKPINKKQSIQNQYVNVFYFFLNIYN